MIDYELCTGCGACKYICSHNAITMKTDEGGFLYPIIDGSKCVHCGLCDRVCEKINTPPQYQTAIRRIALKHKSEDIINRSTSGGAFYLLAKSILDLNGSVYGAAFSLDWNVEHIRCDSINELFRLQKSKYVQSNLKDSYSDAIQDLLDEKWVLFSGTACQCNGLIELLKMKHIPTEKLITCDLICHGVPSPLVWSDYVHFRSRKGTISAIDFRNKDKSWRDFRMQIVTNGRAKTYRQNEDYFMVLFFHNYILRKSCYSCPYSITERISDFTIGDFWGVEQFYPHFTDDKGISVVSINNEKALSFITPLLDDVRYVDISENEMKNNQPNLRRPTPRNARYDQFWIDYTDKGFDYILKRYADKTLLGIFKRRYLFKAMHYTGLFDLVLKIKNRH